jgi:succinate dehydrogenase / fumarate reductase flavoprotein subunit
MVVFVEFEHMLEVAETILLGALKREETRGSHFRRDHPKRDDSSWLKHTIVTRTGAGPRVAYRDVQIGRYAPQERTY